VGYNQDGGTLSCQLQAGRASVGRVAALSTMTQRNSRQLMQRTALKNGPLSVIQNQKVKILCFRFFGIKVTLAVQ
jgi:hypothetical protein